MLRQEMGFSAVETPIIPASLPLLRVRRFCRAGLFENPPLCPVQCLVQTFSVFAVCGFGACV